MGNKLTARFILSDIYLHANCIDFLIFPRKIYNENNFKEFPYEFNTPDKLKNLPTVERLKQFNDQKDKLIDNFNALLKISNNKDPVKKKEDNDLINYYKDFVKGLVINIIPNTNHIEYIKYLGNIQDFLHEYESELASIEKSSFGKSRNFKKRSKKRSKRRSKRRLHI